MSKKYGKLKLSTYKSLLTGKRTMLVASYGKIGTSDYREAQITWYQGAWTYEITDGYNSITVGASTRGLKSCLNLVEGKMLPTPWYVK